jgi:hypothetical protein
MYSDHIIEYFPTLGYTLTEKVIKIISQINDYLTPVEFAVIRIGQHIFDAVKD